MSAIWGVINLDGKSLDEEKVEKMGEVYNKCKIDKIETYYEDNIFLGEAFQYITRESRSEILPYYDGKELYIVADAIIDNREELYKKLKLSKDLKNISDSELILEAYKEWGNKSPEYLIGDFAYVIYSKQAKKIFMARDHTGNRLIYYYYKNSELVFSTLNEPILKYSDYNIKLNKKWEKEFLAFSSVVNQFDLERTAYENILRVEPASYVTIKEKKLSKFYYWDIKNNIKKKKFKNHKECEEEFLKLFTKVIKEKLRTDGKIGITLSGGLDSSSVASVAATLLEKEDKILNSYTSIPLKNYKNKEKDYRIGNEKEYVDEILNKYKNIKGKYIDCRGKHSLSDLEKNLDILEEPFKAINNIYWYTDTFEEAKNDKCKILLNGQFGNFTISWGDEAVSFVTLFEDKKFMKLAKEVLSFSYKNKVPINLVIKKIIHFLRPYKTKYKDNKNYKNLIIKDEYFTEEVEELLNKISVYNRKRNIMSEKEATKFRYDRVGFNQLSLYECKLGLYNGLVVRDPTRDKRIIEFCLSLSIEDYVYNGFGRALIRHSMKGILPDKIRLNSRHRGLQGADWMERIFNSNLNLTFEKIKKYDFLIEKDVEELIEKFNKRTITSMELKFILIILIYNKFIERRKNYGEEKMDRS